MKKFVSLLMSIVMLLSITAGLDLTAFVDTYTSGDYEYTVLDDSTAEITDYTGSAAELTIPSAIDGYTVTTIGCSAFYDCTSLTSITIPESVTNIEADFTYCSSLIEITVSSDNLYYSSDNGVLFDKDKTELICYPAGKTEVSYTILNSVTIIDDCSFSNCTNLNNITNITISNNVISIGYSAFCNCTNLTNITISDSATSIGEWVFYNCTSLESIIISDSVTSIGSVAFASCIGLTSIIIPDSVTYIGDYSFSNCTNLTNITIGRNVTNIDCGTLRDCTSLTDVYYSGSESEWNNITIEEYEGLNDNLLNTTIHYNYSPSTDNNPDSSSQGGNTTTSSTNEAPSSSVTITPSAVIPATVSTAENTPTSSKKCNINIYCQPQKD
ncbi:MAG: leucine-rich repeat domain-containing protein [Clostridiales bacterium]|nr:leucine-rich repeat domain-containing protein [Clostridiales bacterium]